MLAKCNLLRPPTSILTVAVVLGWAPLVQELAAQDCAPDNGGIDLPAGFCAQVFADSVGRARHLVVAPNGDVFVALNASRGGASAAGVLALHDSDGDGIADLRKQFGERGGTGIALHDGHLYFGPDDGVLRYRLAAGSLEPSGLPETIVAGLPDERSHRAKSIVVSSDGALFVNIGAPSNACQEEDRTLGSRGMDPCPELERRAGVWMFDAGGVGQAQSDGKRYATGLRNMLALNLDPLSGQLYGVQHGRDQLGQNWPDLFTPEQSAEKPSEELVRIEEGADFGWPYCYHDPEQDLRVLAPEYGGDGKIAGRCAEKAAPLMAFPAHWAPNALLFYTGTQFPERYRGGAFIAFHGSWNRAPLPQGGYNVAFVPFQNGRPSANWEIFADGFAAGDLSPRGARHRPSGLAQGPDGSLYVSDDKGGRIWRIYYSGE
ncbi:MAG: PQQ-dependent sugar dehydrogenase [Gemmatimonadota bacterium]|nr:MAG: PQQ-dependent sugar dehydrogenase [Gemmatimonadota bacterium]